MLYVLTKREIDPEHAASSIASTSRKSLDEEPPKAVVVLYDVAYAHKSRASAEPPPLSLSGLESSCCGE